MPQHVDTNTSAPIGYYDKLQGNRQSRPPSRAEKHRESASLDRPYDRVKANILKHDKEANPPTRSQSLPPRPPTRRKVLDMPTPRQYSSRARSSGPSSRKNSAQKSRSTRSQRSANSTPPVFAHFTASIKTNPTKEAAHVEVNEKSPSLPTPAPRNAKPRQKDTSFKNSITDHEYLQFSLRITEDIIRNDLYTNKEMRRVFNSHLEANRGRLDMEKMSQQIDNLCKELNVPFDEMQDDDLINSSRPQAKASQQAKENKSSCICGPKPGMLNVELKDCECGSARCLPFQCVQHSVTATENVDNSSITYSTSINTTPNSQRTVKDKSEEEEEVIEVRSIADMEFAEVQFYENDSIPPTPVSMSDYFLALEERDGSDTSIPYYTESDIVAPIRQSLGFLELPLLPSLSRVTEKTEPTTSCETIAKSEISEPNVESSSEFDASDVLPVFEQIEHEKKDPQTISFTESIQKKRNISFGKYKFMKAHPDSKPQTLEKESQKYLLSVQPDNNNLSEIHHSDIKPAGTNLIQQALPSSADRANVLWLICPCNSPPQAASIERTCIHTEEEKSASEGIVPSTSIRSILVSDPHMKTVCTVSSAYYSQPTCASRPATQQTVSETRSEPIKHCKIPVPTPRSQLHETRNENSPSSEIECVNLADSAAESKQSSNISESIKNQVECNCNKENCKSQAVQVLEASNIKIRGLNNQEQEFVLVPGPIYVPKSSIMPVKVESSQNLSILAPETAKKDICTFSKDAVVNTDEQLSTRSNTNSTKKKQSSTSSKFKVIKEPSLSSNISSFNNSIKSSQSTGNNSCAVKSAESDAATYSQLHQLALNTTHYTSFISNISSVGCDLPVTHPPPLSESLLLSDAVKKSIIKAPKLLTDNKVSSVQSSDSGSNILTQLNDYDLTPQRDSNRTAYSNNTLAESQQFSFKDKFTLFNKDGLLLGDEYEIKDDFGSTKSSISSCYDNGLPYSICRFYPNISTQTHSSDFLLPTVPLVTTKKPENKKPQEPQLPKVEPVPVKKELVHEQPDKKSILKKKQLPTNQPLATQIPAEQQPEMKKREMDNKQKLKEEEPVKQQKLEKRESDKQQELQARQKEAVELKLPDNSEERSISFEESNTDKDILSQLLQMDNEEEIFEKEPEDHGKELDDNEQEDYNIIEENKVNERTSEIEENEKEGNEDGGENDQSSDEEDEDEDFLEGLDKPPPSYVHRPSMMLTIKQVTTDLERFRKTEIPDDEFVHSRYNVPRQSLTFTLADDLLPQQALSKKDSNISTGTNISYMGSTSKLPFIEITSSEPLLGTIKDDNNESEHTSCCGLLRGKKKGRRDLVSIDEGSHKIPNISSIPDDQLFEMKPRRPTVEPGYGNERKSLRFDYSAMGQFSAMGQYSYKDDHTDYLRRETLDIKDFTSPYSAGMSLTNVPNYTESNDTVPVVRNTVVSYRTPSMPQQPKVDEAKPATPPVQKNIGTTVNNQHNSVVCILQPQNESMTSIQVMDLPENEDEETIDYS